MVARRITAFLLLCAATLIAGCGPADWGNALVPPLAMRGTRGIQYLPGPDERLDVWRPLCNADHPRPVVVWLYGGYWQNGQRDKYRPLAFPFTSAGCVVVIPDYRLRLGVPFPGFVNDAAAAVGWAHRHAAEFGGDPNRIFLAGHSAGAYVAAMLNLDERYLARQGVPRGVVRGTICLAAPTRFSAEGDPYVHQAFGDYLSRWSRTQPATFVDGDEPPMLLIQGDQDELVTPGSNRYLARVIRAKGGRAVAVSYPKMSHYELLFSMAWPLWGTADVRDWCLRFMRENGAWDGGGGVRLTCGGGGGRGRRRG
jgi:acetyl esterase/lipase